MLKKLALGASGIALAVASIPMFAAFEAHIINVTAKIENAMSVSPAAISYGTVFPQEALNKTVTVGMSESFDLEKGVTAINYMLRQKPKCQLDEGGTGEPYAQVSENAEGQFVCPRDYHQMPLLCPYLSKQNEDTADGKLSSFHGPITGWTATTTVQYQIAASLTKREDPTDTWTIDLHVPCFAGMCAQDWATFVKRTNEAADPAAYVQPVANEHAVFGCDLWFETTGIVRS